MTKAQILSASIIIFSTSLHFVVVATVQGGDAAEYLTAHNAVRQRKGVSPLQWDEKLAKYAQGWAAKRAADCDYKHHSGGPFGENTFWEKYDEFSPTRVTKAWTDEEKNYDDVKFACQCPAETSGCMCGHYTQVVWSNTQRVGCGNVTCNDQLGLLVVCSYDPPGNYADEKPFQKPPRKPAAATRPLSGPAQLRSASPAAKPLSGSTPSHSVVAKVPSGRNSLRSASAGLHPPEMEVKLPAFTGHAGNSSSSPAAHPRKMGKHKRHSHNKGRKHEQRRYPKPSGI